MLKLSKLFGHENVETTVNQYGHLVDEDVREEQNRATLPG
ncbi:hypothetical protein C475_18963 [Halosimplex carlsbadense 2-9-1]|uniref:Integrase n=1 Tax=Halosimplex carlsbadense 2-9-1 TaxID=797114 RepID=M0CGS3_9EURY|nr:hypothetical protein C475_18963 [Halosimplex carlsbadense 2-9-1]